MASMNVNITMGSVSTGTVANGKSAGSKFTKSRSIAHFSNGDKEVTVMAFGEQRDSVLSSLRKGRNITVSAVWEGRNLLKILGPARERAAPAEAEAA